MFSQILGIYMVKLLLFLSLLYLISNGAQAANDWSSLSPGEFYELKESLEISESKLNLKAGTKLKLVEKSDLNMIKVKHFKYKINDCKLYGSAALNETAIELIPVDHLSNEGVSVGVNVAKDCMLEVYVQESDSKSQTFFI